MAGVGNRLGRLEKGQEVLVASGLQENGADRHRADARIEQVPHIPPVGPAREGNGDPGAGGRDQARRHQGKAVEGLARKVHGTAGKLLLFDGHRQGIRELDPEAEVLAVGIGRQALNQVHGRIHAQFLLEDAFRNLFLKAVGLQKLIYIFPADNRGIQLHEGVEALSQQVGSDIIDFLPGAPVHGGKGHGICDAGLFFNRIDVLCRNPGKFLHMLPQVFDVPLPGGIFRSVLHGTKKSRHRLGLDSLQVVADAGNEAGQALQGEFLRQHPNQKVGPDIFLRRGFRGEFRRPLGIINCVPDIDAGLREAQFLSGEDLDGFQLDDARPGSPAGNNSRRCLGMGAGRNANPFVPGPLCERDLLKSPVFLEFCQKMCELRAEVTGFHLIHGILQHPLPSKTPDPIQNTRT